MQHSGTALIDPLKIFDKIGLSEGMRVADLGCGRTGHFVFPASRVVGKTGLVYAVDIMKDVLENINSWIRSEALDNIQTIWSDIEVINKTPIPGKSLDTCFFMNVLFQVKNKEGALTEASRLLKDDGQIVVVDWLKKLSTLGPSQDMLLTSNKIKDIAETCGLRLVENLPINDYHYCLIFKKV